MNSIRENGEENGKESVTVRLPREIVERLECFRLEHAVTVDAVVERALREYFTEGDMSH